MILIVYIISSSYIASFILWLSDVIVHKKDIWQTRSLCDHCYRQLSWYELIPIFSYIVLKGRCKSCKQAIGIKVLFIEVFYPLIYTLAYYKLPIYPSYLFFLILFNILVIASIIDIHLQIIYDINILILLVYSIAYRSFYRIPLLDNTIFTFIVLIVLFLFAYLSKGLGMGDVKLIGVLSYLLPLRKFIMMWYISIFLCLIYSTFLLMRGSSIKTSIPFVPFISLATILVQLL